jgi:hypothetical protein
MAEEGPDALTGRPRGGRPRQLASWVHAPSQENGTKNAELQGLALPVDPHLRPGVQRWPGRRWEG